MYVSTQYHRMGRICDRTGIKYFGTLDRAGCPAREPSWDHWIPLRQVDGVTGQGHGAVGLNRAGGCAREMPTGVSMSGFGSWELGSSLACLISSRSSDLWWPNLSRRWLGMSTHSGCDGLDPTRVFSKPAGIRAQNTGDPIIH